MPPPKPEYTRIMVASPDFMGVHLEKTHFFLQGMMNRLSVSHWKYGSIHDTFPEHRKGVDNIQLRVDKYLETGNTEWLIDAANYALIEFMRPSHPNPLFKATDSDESPGAVNADGTISHGKVGE